MSNNPKFVEKLANKFLRHLGSIDRLKRSYDEGEQSQGNKGHNGLGERVAYVAYVKIEHLKAQNANDEERQNYFQEKISRIEESEVLNRISSSVIVEEKEDSYIFRLESGILIRAYDEYTKTTLDDSYDNEQFHNSLIISLVIGLEMLIGELIKDHILNLDPTNQTLKDKKISYNSLIDMESVDEAKDLLMDTYIEEVLRGTFYKWIKEIKSVLNVDVEKDEIMKDGIKHINEIIQRRHIIIHNDGIINEHYLNKIDEDLKAKVVKGEKIETGEDYIQSRTSIIRSFGLILLYQYSKRRYRGEEKILFSEFNSILLQLLDKECNATRFILKEFSMNSQLNPSSQDLSKINYFLTFKLIGDNSIDEEIRNYSSLSGESKFESAKKIMLDYDKSDEHAIDLMKNLGDIDFIDSISWPIMRMAKKSDSYKAYVDNRIQSIMEKELEVDLNEQ